MRTGEALGFGARLKHHREAAGVTQEALAERAGISARAVSDLERGVSRVPHRDTVEVLARALGLTTEEAGALEAAVARERGPLPRQQGPSSAGLGPAAPALPTGVVTFLLTDVEGSTRFWERQPEQMRWALLAHDALIERLTAQHGGVVVRPRGEEDSRFAVFPRAPQAAAAAAAIQQALHAAPWPPETPLRVRLALHTGEADLRAGDYFGAAVNRCVRLRAAGHGGQALLSQATAELVRDALPEGARLRDLGERRLKDLIRPERVYQLCPAGLPDGFPPLITLDARPHNLPVQPTPLLGREDDVQVAREQLLREGVRLLTLTGPGGVGKTRLGLQVAAELIDEFENGVYVVALAPVGDPALVVPAIAQALGVRAAGGRPLEEALRQFLRDRQLLVVLDNCEHLPGAAATAAMLLAACPRLRVLATSRAALRVRGEHERPVGPLPVPDPRRLPSLSVEELTAYPSVALFVQRAAAVRPGLTLTNENAAAVAGICHRVDGLPLALELAAARSKLLPPQALLARLSSRLTVLTGGARDLEPRQQTLRATIDWSHRLLDQSARTLFARLGVFVGGCTLEAAEAMGGASGGPPVNVLEALAALVDNSLLHQEETAGGAPRFWMLETIREYALERLAESGEAESVRQRHAAHYLALAEQAAPELTGSHQSGWLDRLNQDHDNLRAALDWLTDQAGTEERLRLAGALWRFWVTRGHLEEGQRRLEQALAEATSGLAIPSLDGDAPRTASRPPVSAGVGTLDSTLDSRLAWRAEALHGAGSLARARGDYDRAAALLGEGLALRRASGDARGLAWTVRELALVIKFGGDWARTRALLEESLALFRQAGDQNGAASALFELGDLTRIEGGYEQAAALLEEGAALFRGTGNIQGLGETLTHLGNVLRYLGDTARAVALLEESLALLQQTGDRPATVLTLFYLAAFARARGDTVRARAFLTQSHDLAQALGDRRNVAWTRHEFGCIARVEGDYAQARVLLEESIAQFDALGHRRGVAGSLYKLGTVVGLQGDRARARALLEAALTIMRELGERPGVAACLQRCGELAVAQGDHAAGVQLMAAAAATHPLLSIALDPDERASRDSCLAAARAALGDAAFAAAWAAGQAREEGGSGTSS